MGLLKNSGLSLPQAALKLKFSVVNFTCNAFTSLGFLPRKLSDFKEAIAEALVDDWFLLVLVFVVLFPLALLGLFLVYGNVFYVLVLVAKKFVAKMIDSWLGFGGDEEYALKTQGAGQGRKDEDEGVFYVRHSYSNEEDGNDDGDEEDSSDYSSSFCDDTKSEDDDEEEESSYYSCSFCDDTKSEDDESDASSSEEDEEGTHEEEEEEDDDNGEEEAAAMGKEEEESQGSDADDDEKGREDDSQHEHEEENGGSSDDEGDYGNNKDDDDDEDSDNDESNKDEDAEDR